MRKYIIGAVFGAVLSFSVSAYAEVVNLVNQVVQGLFPVTVDGKSLGNAIVVDNTTYLPVRDFGEAVGYTVTFTDDKQVVLTKKVISPTSEIQAIQKRYNEIGDELSKLIPQKNEILMKIGDIDSGKSKDTNRDDLQKQAEELQKQIDSLIAEKQSLEPKLMGQQ
jgi:chaperonin cofactor prefoldin